MTNDEIKALAREVGAVVDAPTSPQISAYISMTGAQLQRFARLCIAQGLEMGAERCLDESVDADGTGRDDDKAYNTAIEHCSSALHHMAAEMKKCE